MCIFRVVLWPKFRFALNLKTDGIRPFKRWDLSWMWFEIYIFILLACLWWKIAMNWDNFHMHCKLRWLKDALEKIVNDFIILKLFSVRLVWSLSQITSRTFPPTLPKSLLQITSQVKLLKIILTGFVVLLHLLPPPSSPPLRKIFFKLPEVPKYKTNW